MPAHARPNLPSTPFQLTVLTISLLRRLFPEAPTLASFCRVVLDEADSHTAKETLWRLRHRAYRAARRGGSPRDDLAPVLRWFSRERPSAGLWRDATARYLDLLGPHSTLATVPEACEALICLHLGLGGGADRRELADAAFAALSGGPPKARLAKGVPLHLCLDAAYDIVPGLLAHRAAYEEPEFTYSLALASCAGVSGLADRHLQEELDQLDREGRRAELGLCALHLVLRVGTLPLSQAPVWAGRHLGALRERHPRLHAVSRDEFVARARRSDYATDLGEVVAAHKAPDFDALGLAEGALRWLRASGARGQAAGFGPKEFALSTRRFTKWGLTHGLCRPLMRLAELPGPQWAVLRALALRGSDMQLLPVIEEQLRRWIEGDGL